jgi:AcrR family transcriptional regulator
MTEATGLTKGSIYGNFEDKDAVAVAAFDYNAGKIQDIVRGEMDRYEGIRDKLLIYVHVYQNLDKYPFPTGGCPLLNTAVDADDTHPVLKAKVSGVVQGMKDRLVALLEEGVRRGEFKPTVNAEQVALTMLATIEGCIMISNLSGKARDMKLIMQSVEDTIRNL